MSKIMLCPEKNRDVTNNILVSFKKKNVSEIIYILKKYSKVLRYKNSLSH
jgi:hypothetical protein